MRRTALILLSGGVDSIACAHLLRAQGFEVNGLFLDYGQAAAGPERRSAEALARHVAFPLEVASLSSSQNFSTGEVVGRNAFFVFSALMLIRARFNLIVLGVH